MWVMLCLRNRRARSSCGSDRHDPPVRPVWWNTGRERVAEERGGHCDPQWVEFDSRCGKAAVFKTRTRLFQGEAVAIDRRKKTRSCEGGDPP